MLPGTYVSRQSGIVGRVSTRHVGLVWFNIDLPDGAAIQDAINCSGILKQFPEIDLEQNKVGIFGKVSKLDAVLSDGDRVEIYRPTTCDPKTVPRKAKAGADAAEA